MTSSVVSLGCGVSVDVLATLDSAQSIVQPVVGALKEHHTKHGKYPDSLQGLIEDRQLQQIPILPSIRGTYDVYQLEYAVSPDGLFYKLQFAYDFPGGLGPSNIKSRHYISLRGKWEAGTGPSLSRALSEHSGQLYRDRGSSNALANAVDDLVKAHDGGNGCAGLFEVTVTTVLGPGESCEVPSHLECGEGCRALKYAGKRSGEPCFVFVFKPESLVACEDKVFWMAESVYSVTGGDEETESWKLVTKCR